MNLEAARTPLSGQPFVGVFTMVREWVTCNWQLLAAIAFYVSASILVVFDLLAMLRALTPTHADALWLFSFAHDIWAGIPIGGWRLPGAPIYFPDLASVFVSTGLGLSVSSTMIIHGLLSWTFITGGICCGIRVGGLSWAQGLRAAAATLLVYVLAHGDGRLLAEFHFPFSHGGATLGAFLGVIFVGYALQNGYTVQSASIAVLCLGLLVASDRAILAQLVLPVALTAGIFLVFNWASRRRLVLIFGLLFGGSTLGWAINGVLRWQTGLEFAALDSDFSWAAAVITFWKVLEDLSQLTLLRPLVFASVVVPVAFLIFTVLSGAGERLRWGRARPALDFKGVFEWWTACAGLAVLLGTLGAVIATHSWSLRYILPVMIVPLGLSVIIATPQLPAVNAGVARMLELSLIAVVTVLATQGPGADPSVLYTRNALQYACLDRFTTQEGLRAGYAEYWQSRPPMVLGQTQLTVAEVDARMIPRRWANNAFWYTRGYFPSDERPPLYDFIITKSLDEGWLSARFGVPRAKEGCFDFVVWVYDRPMDVEFRNYLRTPMARQTGDHDGWWETSDFKRAPDGENRPVVFEGSAGAVIAFPHVPANVVEIASPTRRPLDLAYQRGGVEVGRQRVEFFDDGRRLLALPASIGAAGIDSVTVHGVPGVSHALTDVVLMFDARVGFANP